MSRYNESANSFRPFHVSQRPLVSRQASAGGGVSDSFGISCADFNVLPRSYGGSVVFAIARDPKSLFVYWDIDWSNAFTKGKPYDRKVYLRVYDGNGHQLDRIEIEPLANSTEVLVPKAASSYRVEIGYFNSERVWHAVGSSSLVTAPPDKIGALSLGDFALIPFHITFQRLTELFRARSMDVPLTQALATFQQAASDPQMCGSFTCAEQEVYLAMKASVREREYRPRTSLDWKRETELQKKLEQVVGFGPTSPRNAFGGSSRTT